ncbi:MAG: SUMF1/EgtB/PvdO family nonheme iron enzyme [Nitrospinae bacterium]|nr:SUMF1/EgtB/PvdO family nonheme iron enzyme [Nitrospinota bacterium]
MKTFFKIFIPIALLVFVFVGTSVKPATAFKNYSNMEMVPAGEFWMGSAPEETKGFKEKYGNREPYKSYPFEKEQPKRKVFLKAFLIDRHEVTNREYLEFVAATGHKPPVNWEGGSPSSEQLDHPALFISQPEAAAYARWAGKRLPTEEEWEKAARGPDGLIFPWGNAFDPFKAATAESDLAFISGALCAIHSGNRVEIAPGDVSPYGVHDMAGNVREWTSSASQESPSLVVIKGGSWVDLSVNARAAHREYVPRDGTSHLIGFRCVVDADEASSH